MLLNISWKWHVVLMLWSACLFCSSQSKTLRIVAVGIFFFSVDQLLVMGLYWWWPPLARGTRIAPRPPRPASMTSYQHPKHLPLTPPACLREERLPLDIWKQWNRDLNRGRKERGHTLHVTRTFRVVGNELLIQKYDAATQARSSKQPDRTMMLYHGTRGHNLPAICTQGFRLPTVKGMFGAAIYFAEVPQKSCNYTDIPHGWTHGHILICKVYVGRTKKVKVACRDLAADKLVKRRYLVRKIRCDTAHAPAGKSTVSDEHMVFDPDLIVPMYVVEVRIS